MPELPEVEVTKRGIEKVLLNSTITKVFIGEKSLREPLSSKLKELEGAKVLKLSRRAKYIIISTDKGSIILHLGMSGHLKILDYNVDLILHDHFALYLDNGKSIRLNDPRRFGLVLFVPLGEDPYQNKHLSSLALEPFDPKFTKEYLKEKIKNKKMSIKQALMDSKVVVGVGNIYASEVLFLSKIDPRRNANTVSLDECALLVKNIVSVLRASIARGGTTLRDFSGADGKPGYYVQDLNVYGHEGKPCPICQSPICNVTLGQRSTFYCPKCQK